MSMAGGFLQHNINTMLTFEDLNVLFMFTHMLLVISILHIFILKHPKKASEKITSVLFGDN